jgi:dTMP kinase
LQHRTAAVYAELAATHWNGQWSVVTADADPADLAAWAWQPSG